MNLPPRDEQHNNLMNLHDYVVESFEKYIPPSHWFMPDYSYGVIIYPHLQGFKSDKPIDNKVRDLYLLKLTSVVQWLQDSLVSHNDLRPENIMYKVEQNGFMNFKLLDFEDASFIGEPYGLQFEFMKLCTRDSRYPVFKDSLDESSCASNENNQFFLTAITRFVNSEYNFFSDFMNGAMNQEIKREVQQLKDEPLHEVQDETRDPTYPSNLKFGAKV